jgi:hypothetical protein
MYLKAILGIGNCHLDTYGRRKKEEVLSPRKEGRSNKSRG